MSGYGTSQFEKVNELTNHELTLHEINTLEWSDLVGGSPYVDFASDRGGNILMLLKNLFMLESFLIYDCSISGDVSALEQPSHREVNNFINNVSSKLLIGFLLSVSIWFTLVFKSFITVCWSCYEYLFLLKFFLKKPSHWAVQWVKLVATVY